MQVLLISAVCNDSFDFPMVQATKRDEPVGPSLGDLAVGAAALAIWREDERSIVA